MSSYAERAYIRKLRGQCVSCTRPPVSGRTRCAACIANSEAAVLRYVMPRRSGKCSRCGVEIKKSPTRFCAPCRYFRKTTHRNRRVVASKSHFDGVRNWVAMTSSVPIAVIDLFGRGIYDEGDLQLTEFAWDASIAPGIDVSYEERDDWRDQQLADGASSNRWTIWSER